MSSEEAALDEKVHVWPAQGDCPAAQPHGTEPRPCAWVGVVEAVAPKESVVVGVPELEGVGVFEGDLKGVLEVVGVAVSVVVAVKVAVSVGGGEKVGVAVGVIDTERVDVLEGV